MSRFLDSANALTLLSLAFAVACALLAINGRPERAAAALILAGLCDLFDGWVARRLTRTDEQRHFGARLDSVVDACAFGFAPVVLLYASGLTGPAEVAVLVLFAACAVWRLAYFDTVTLSEGPVAYHHGLPTTYAALVLPLAYLVGVPAPGWRRAVLAGAALGLAAAMVSTRRVPKPRGAAYAVFLLAALVGIGALLLTEPAHGSSHRP